MISTSRPPNILSMYYITKAKYKKARELRLRLSINCFYSLLVILFLGNSFKANKKN